MALESFAALEPDPSFKGVRTVFSRTSHGWTATSGVAPGATGSDLEWELLSPDLSQVAFKTQSPLNAVEEPPSMFELGPVGGPYAIAADVPSGYRSHFVGANGGTETVAPFTDVLLDSPDHQLLPEGPERTVAEDTEQGKSDLYDWTDGSLRLVNVEGEAPDVRQLNSCGAELGAGIESNSALTAGAVSQDGSKIFFTSCGNRLYMRVEGRETVEVSAPAPGVALKSSEREPVYFNAATPDGSEVVFNTSTPLLKGETAGVHRLFIFNTATRTLTLIRDGFSNSEERGTGGRFVLLSDDGSAVYYNTSEIIYRYETRTGKTSFVAAISPPQAFNEPSYTTPNGQYLVFVSGATNGIEVAGPHGLEPEPRGFGHNELYRYDAADGSTTCVSCGPGVAPAAGNMYESHGVWVASDEMPPFIQMSEDGQEVFFQTTAQLVPQDTNSTNENPSSAQEDSGMDVYEWEAEGTEEAPGVVCRVINGCTHLISTGEDVGKSTFLGASQDGSNVFFATAAQLVPQATPEFSNIYDARVNGGFPPPVEPRPCLSCQGVGSTAPLFNAPASGAFTGAGNPVPVSTQERTHTTSKSVKCRKGFAKKKGRCVKVSRRKKAGKASRGARR
ncbi:MAG: hypothetical protein ACRDLF_01105 [Solirubrobacteraceae bacterium]